MYSFLKAARDLVSKFPGIFSYFKHDDMARVAKGGKRNVMTEEEKAKAKEKARITREMNKAKEEARIEEEREINRIDFFVNRYVVIDSDGNMGLNGATFFRDAFNDFEIDNSFLRLVEIYKDRLEQIQKRGGDNTQKANMLLTLFKFLGEKIDEGKNNTAVAINDFLDSYFDKGKVDTAKLNEEYGDRISSLFKNALEMAEKFEEPDKLNIKTKLDKINKAIKSEAFVGELRNFVNNEIFNNCCVESNGGLKVDYDKTATAAFDGLNEKADFEKKLDKAAHIVKSHPEIDSQNILGKINEALRTLRQQAESYRNILAKSIRDFKGLNSREERGNILDNLRDVVEDIEEDNFNSPFVKKVREIYDELDDKYYKMYSKTNISQQEVGEIDDEDTSPERVEAILDHIKEEAKNGDEYAKELAMHYGIDHELLQERLNEGEDNLKNGSNEAQAVSNAISQASTTKKRGKKGEKAEVIDYGIEWGPEFFEQFNSAPKEGKKRVITVLEKLKNDNNALADKVLQFVLAMENGKIKNPGAAKDAFQKDFDNYNPDGDDYDRMLSEIGRKDKFKYDKLTMEERGKTDEEMEGWEIENLKKAMDKYFYVLFDKCFDAAKLSVDKGSVGNIQEIQDTLMKDLKNSPEGSLIKEIVSKAFTQNFPMSTTDRSHYPFRKVRPQIEGYTELAGDLMCLVNQPFVGLNNEADFTLDKYKRPVSRERMNNISGEDPSRNMRLTLWNKQGQDYLANFVGKVITEIQEYAKTGAAKGTLKTELENARGDQAVRDPHERYIVNPDNENVKKDTKGFLNGLFSGLESLKTTISGYMNRLINNGQGYSSLTDSKGGARIERAMSEMKAWTNDDGSEVTAQDILDNMMYKNRDKNVKRSPYVLELIDRKVENIAKEITSEELKEILRNKDAGVVSENEEAPHAVPYDDFCVVFLWHFMKCAFQVDVGSPNMIFDSGRISIDFPCSALGEHYNADENSMKDFFNGSRITSDQFTKAVMQSFKEKQFFNDGVMEQVRNAPFTIFEDVMKNAQLAAKAFEEIKTEVGITDKVGGADNVFEGSTNVEVRKGFSRSLINECKRIVKSVMDKSDNQGKQKKDKIHMNPELYTEAVRSIGFLIEKLFGSDGAYSSILNRIKNPSSLKDKKFMFENRRTQRYENLLKEFTKAEESIRKDYELMSKSERSDYVEKVNNVNAGKEFTFTTKAYEKLRKIFDSSKRTSDTVDFVRNNPELNLKIKDIFDKKLKLVLANPNLNNYLSFPDRRQKFADALNELYNRAGEELEQLNKEDLTKMGWKDVSIEELLLGWEKNFNKDFDLLIRRVLKTGGRKSWESIKVHLLQEDDVEKAKKSLGNDVVFSYIVNNYAKFAQNYFDYQKQIINISICCEFAKIIIKTGLYNEDGIKKVIKKNVFKYALWQNDGFLGARKAVCDAIFEKMTTESEKVNLTTNLGGIPAQVSTEDVVDYISGASKNFPTSSPALLINYATSGDAMKFYKAVRDNMHIGRLVSEILRSEAVKKAEEDLEKAASMIIFNKKGPSTTFETGGYVRERVVPSRVSYVVDRVSRIASVVAGGPIAAYLSSAARYMLSEDCLDDRVRLGFEARIWSSGVKKRRGSKKYA